MASHRGASALQTVVRQLLDVRVWTAFDVDAEGRVLAGHDELGSLQLVEIADGTRTPLMQLSLLDLSGGRSEPASLDDLTPLVHDPAFMHVLFDVTATSLIYSTNRRNGVDMDVVVRDLGSDEERVVYDAGGYVMDTVVSHDEQSVAVTSLSLRPNSTFVSLAGQRTGAGAHLTDPEELAQHECVAWAADDDALILTSNHDREFEAVLRFSLDGTRWTTLVADSQHDLYSWTSPDGGSIAVSTLDHGVGRLSIHESDGRRRRAVDLPADGIPSVVWAADGSRFVVSLTTATDPGSIHLVDAATGRASLVVDGSDGIPESLRGQLVSPTTHRVPTSDGEEVPCFVYPPAPGGDPALAGASVLHIHGGPESAARRVFSPLIQALSALGVTVLVPNVRGSIDYGKRWAALDDVELRLDSVADLAALHDWLPSQGLDQSRSALWGGSYGGYMVPGVSMQPDLWAAGVDIVGMSSLVTFLESTSGYRRAYREREYGSLKHDRAFLEKASPITYLDDIRAPVFVIHGANDPRVPLSEAQQIKAALDRREVECQLKVYSDEGHGLAKRPNRLDAYPAALEFLRRQLS